MFRLKIQLFGGRGRKSGLGLKRGISFAEASLNNSNCKKIKHNRFDNLDEWEKYIRRKNYEVLVVFKDGNPISAYKGDNTSIKPPLQEMSSWKNCIVTHNHPNNTTFSDEDLLSFSRHEYKQIRAVVKSGVFVFESTPESDYNGLFADLINSFDSKKNEINKKCKNLTNAYENGKLKISSEELERYLFKFQIRHYNEFYEELANSNNFKFSFIKKNIKQLTL